MSSSRTWPTLYKKNKNGSFQQWTISIEEDYRGVYFITKEYGQVGGALQVSDPDYIIGKNIGKSNETTSLEQATKEAEAQWTKKKTGGKGYVEDLTMAEAGEKDALVQGGISPMLAHTFSKQGHKIKFPAFAQPKLDGIRCIATIVDGKASLWTRTQKPIVSMPHIIAELERLYPYRTITLDGELYNHAYHDHFEDIVSLVRPEYVKPGSEVVQYHVYDIAGMGTFEQRLNQLREDIGANTDDDDTIYFVETIVVKDLEDLLEYFNECRFANYEGTIARNADGLYANSRSYDLQKLKEFEDAEFKIVDVVDGRGKMAGKAVFVCETADGAQFNVKMEGALDVLEEIFNSKELAIGKLLTVRYQGLTNGNVPRFPIGVGIRDYE
jgi:DNA ligase-1